MLSYICKSDIWCSILDSRRWMVLFGSLLIHLFFSKDFDRWVQWIGDNYSVYHFLKFKIIIMLYHPWFLLKIRDFIRDFFFFRDFFWRSGLLEYWIRPYVRGHWFGRSPRPGTPLNSLCQEVGFISPFVVIDPAYLGATTMIVAPGLMLDNFLPIPDTESLPFDPLVLKLVVCVCVCHTVSGPPKHPWIRALIDRQGRNRSA